MSKKIILLLFTVIASFQLAFSENKTIRVLTIGNSFSEDAVENYLHDLGKADGVTLIIGNMYIGGCSLETHWNNATNNSKSYSFRKIDASGVKKTTDKVALSEAIVNEEWDYITFQQVSQNSGKSTTYQPYLRNLLSYVKARATNEDVKYGLHMTWAYSKDSGHSGFNNYNKDQMRMYNEIVNAVSSVAKSTGIELIIPAGTAIQNARTSFIGDNFCRDGYHLDLGIGRYTAACTWYEMLTGNSVQDNAYIPSSLTRLYASIAQQAAHFAVATPSSVTDMSALNPLPDSDTFSLTNPVNIDFGGSSSLSPIPWNNMSSHSKGSSILGIFDMEGELTPFKVEILTPFGGVNTNGPVAGLNNEKWVLPKEATSDSFWGNAGETFGGVNIVTASIQLSGLNAKKKYDFSVLSSRNLVGDNRETSISVEGNNSDKVLVNSSNNTKNMAVIEKIQPKEDGTITITFGAGSNNNNKNGFFYLNALQIRQNGDESSSKSLFDEELSIRLESGFVSNSVKILELDQTSQYAYQIYSIDGRSKQQGLLTLGNDNIDVSSLHPSYYILRLKEQSSPINVRLNFLKNSY